MLHRGIVLCVVAVTVLAVSPNLVQVVAQEGPHAYTSYELNMRTGPGVAYDVIAVLPANTGMVFEASDGDIAWLLGRTEDGALRGWVASLYLTYQPGFSAARLPFSDEVIPFQAAPSLAPAVAPAEAAPTGDEPPTNNPNAFSLETIPIVPAIGGTARQIFERGQAMGNNANVFAKVGECNTLSHAFMSPYSVGMYDLGPYGTLQATIDFFTPASFGDESVASGAGYTSALVVDPAWTNPRVCPANVSLLECEFDRIRPSVVLVNLGMHDVHSLSSQQYADALRRIIEVSMGRGIIPVLGTFPIYPYGDDLTAKRYEFNMIVISLARQYDIPLINFWQAAEELPHRGVGDDHVHLTHNPDQTSTFTGDENQYGFTMLNLVTLQTLDELRRTVLAN